MGEVVQFKRPPWWLRFDWGPEFGLSSINERAIVIADMMGDTDDERAAYFDEIATDMRKYYHLTG